MIYKCAVEIGITNWPTLKLLIFDGIAFPRPTMTEYKREEMNAEFCCGDAVRHIEKGVIVKLTSIDGDLVTVETPSGHTSQHAKAELTKCGLNSLELASAFDMVNRGWGWGGWNRENTKNPVCTLD